MKPVLTPEEAAALDRDTQSRGIAAEALMERAGRAVARAARELAGGTYGRRVAVVCGKGNNGGDGLVAARHLARNGVRTTVVLLGDLVSLYLAVLAGVDPVDIEPIDRLKARLR